MKVPVDYARLRVFFRMLDLTDDLIARKFLVVYCHDFRVHFPAVLVAFVALEFLAVVRVLKHFLVGHRVTLLEGPTSSFLGNKFHNAVFLRLFRYISKLPRSGVCCLVLEVRH